jgi:hypothetical protein
MLLAKWIWWGANESESLPGCMMGAACAKFNAGPRIDADKDGTKGKNHEKK